MAHVFRRFASVRIGKMHNRTKEQCSSDVFKSESLNKERDKLLQEFLFARDELKGQFDYEKHELVTNYERRIKYLRRLVEEYDENVNMLKLNLDAEKEDNFLLKTKILELENQRKKRENTPGYQNQSYDDESTLSIEDGTYTDDDDDTGTLTRQKSSIDTLMHGKSSIHGLKYSDKFVSNDSIAKSSFTSITSIASDFDGDIHHNCREEFNRLLDELRLQKKKYEDNLEREKYNMVEQIENERLQLEKIVYKQLNLKLDKEVKKHEFLHTEHAHLQKTITHTIIESFLDQLKPKHSPNHETNSDSGADVEDNRSDDDSDISNVDRAYTIASVCKKQDEESIPVTLICKILQEQKVRLTSEYQKLYQKEQKKLKIIIDDLNREIVLLVKENRSLKQRLMMEGDCYDEVSEFHHELTQKLYNLEELLVNDPDAC